jgi:hypothetical protein
MTPAELHTSTVFVQSLRLMHVDDDGLTDACDATDLNAIHQICPDVVNIGAVGDTPYALALWRLASLTERVLMTWGRPDPQAVKAWLLARAEVLDLKLGAQG